ncbi:hypothetical protein [Lutibacter citreus]|nr:hypothetical protein [Lutibacter citreus]
MYDLTNDSKEVNNVYNNPKYKNLIKRLR